ncbi:hypothetical protein L596_021449 [Steinernema carpocapsae]|uniref:Uncharacterized protein n=1 Tax=Steinernema carpocapsae TaxID=34508 RepID=A0A4U5MIT4_STECR|nr:hypothetical protein L596_021449 [Steinernema carpocapsae]
MRHSTGGVIERRRNGGADKRVVREGSDGREGREGKDHGVSFCRVNDVDLERGRFGKACEAFRRNPVRRSVVAPPGQDTMHWELTWLRWNGDRSVVWVSCRRPESNR